MKLIFISLLITSSLFLNAQTPTSEEISNIATNFVHLKNERRSIKLKNAVIQQIKKIESVEYENKTLFHVVELEQKGFIVISNDKSLNPIIAYSEDSSFNYSEDSSNVFFHFLKNDLLKRELKKIGIDKWEVQMNQLKSAVATEFQQWPEEGATPTGGWIETSWDQSAPQNSLCPKIDKTERAAAGCVPIAVSQLINYHKILGEYILENNDRYSTYTRNISIDGDANGMSFPDIPILNSYLNDVKNNYKNDIPLTDFNIASLVFGVGVGLHSDYDYLTGAYSMDIPNFFKNRLNYYSSADEHSFYYLSKDNSSLMLSNLINGYPCIISGRIGGLGHAYICDGYNTDNFFHINFGWGGTNNIWYDFTSIGDIGASSIFYDIFPSKPDYKFKVNKKEIVFAPTHLGDSNNQSIKINNSSQNQIEIRLNYDADISISLDNKVFQNNIKELTVEGNKEIEVFLKLTPTEIKPYSNFIFLESGDQKEIIKYSGYGIPVGGTSVLESASGIWSKENSPYYIGSNIQILDSLIIEAGTEVVFLGSYNLRIQRGAILLANGTEKDSIVFKPFSDEIAWEGLYFENISKVQGLNIIKYSNFTGAKNDQSRASAVTVGGVNILISHCTFSNFSSEVSPGAIEIPYSKNTIIEFCEFYNNVGFYGGAIKSEGNISISNSLFYNNKSVNGGALYLQTELESKAVLKNLTITKNEAEAGGGIYIWGNSGLFENLIMYNNASDFGKEIVCNPKSVNELMVISFSNIDTSSSNWSNGNILFQNCIHKNPLFQNFGSNNFHLHSNSPSVDMGNTIDNFSKEPKPNGFCINQGYYGGTVAATMSTGTKLLVVPNNLNLGIVRLTDTSSLVVKIYSSGSNSVSIHKIFLKIGSNFRLSETLSLGDLNAGDSLFVQIDQDMSTVKENKAIIDTLVIQTDVSDYFVPISIFPYMGTIVESDSISGVLKAEDSPFYFKQNVAIKSRKQLIIEVGCKLYFSSNSSLLIPAGSSLIGQGSGSNRTIMTCSDSTETWNGLIFQNSKSNHLNGFDFSRCYKSSKGGAINLNYSEIVIENCKFENCEAGTMGGAIYADNSKIKINKSSFKNNRASFEGNGGGAISTIYSSLDIYHTEFINNITRVYGGALKIDNGTFIISNCLFKNNLQESEYFSGGGAITSMFCIGTIENTDFVENKGLKGGAIFLDYKNNIEVVNSIFYNNSAFAEGNHISINNDRLNPDNLTLTNCCIDTLGSNWLHYGTAMSSVNHQNNIFINPGFASGINLSALSPCIDKGDNQNLKEKEMDLLNMKRIWDGNNDGNAVIDIGCVEYGVPYIEEYSICSGDTLLINGRNYYSETSLLDTLISFSGMDSVILRQVHVLPSYAYTNDITICKGENYNGLTDTETYIDTFLTVLGCDSIITTNLTVLPTFENIEDITICEGEKYHGWNSEGQFLESFTTVLGCDSVVTINLSFFPTYQPSIEEHLDTLKSINSYQIYQWFDETGDIIGATNKQLVIEKSGEYHLMVTDDNGCTQISESMFVVKTNLEDFMNSNFKYKIIPNPNNGIFSFEIESNPFDKVLLKLLNSIGQTIEVRTVKYAGNIHSEQFDISRLSKGIYHLSISSDNYQKSEKIVVQ